MDTAPVTSDRLRASIVAVPPLARNPDLSFSPEENGKIISHIEAGGVNTLLYGGNANFYHIALSEYESVLRPLAETAGPDTLVIPAVGPAFGTMMDQARILRDFEFPTAMILPQQGIVTDDGAETGIRRFAESLGKPVVVYIKHEGFIEPENVARLAADGLVSWVKYAIVREDTANDDYLRRLIDLVDPNLIVSGMGEQPATTHLRDFGLAGFTSGCVCVRPDLSQEMLKALQSGDYDRAEEIRRIFIPLEDLRNQINPIRVLHDALSLCGIAETGPALPLLSNLDESDKPAVEAAARELLTR